MSTWYAVCFPKIVEDNYYLAVQKITLVIKGHAALCLMASGFVSTDEFHYLNDNEWVGESDAADLCN